uniref:Hypoxia up-regulated protein 1 n=1 Tax=Aceria tosichella TaxID=561515 RepID=A0A6G1SGL8_9ACAR
MAYCKLSLILLLSVLACTITFNSGMVHCYGVMSVDLGSEWMKVGLVAPNVPMDLVLNDQSNRKTSMAIAISNGERFIGDAALDVAIKYPDRTFTYFLDLVGKSLNDESVKQYKQKFPYADISSHEPNSTSIILNHPEGASFTPLELVAMMLQLARDQVLNRLGTHEQISDVVITVPPFFNSIEKKVVRDAANLAGLNVLRFTQTNAAFALSYGIFRHKDYLPENSDNKTSIIFFDQGATHTSVTVADYHMIEQVDPVTFASKNESLPTVTIRAQVYDRFLGGFDMQLRLRDHLIQAFCKETKTDPERIYKRGRSFSKVLKEAGRVKRVLSANTDFLVRIENVIDDKDLRFPITRKDLEDMNDDLLTTRITQLLDKLFEQPEVSRDERFESVIIVGGNTRTPRVQQILLDYFKLDSLGKSVNADEGAALAALYQAASLGRGFRVKKFALEEYGEERLRYDPAKVIVTTTTPAPPTTEEPATTTTAPETTQPTESPELDVGATTAQPNETTQTSTTEEPTTTTTTPAPIVTTTPDPEAIYSQSELDRIGKKLAMMREDDFTRLQRLLELNRIELDEIENERKASEKGTEGESSEEKPPESAAEVGADKEEKKSEEEIKRLEL